ncbi:putative nuclear RNA export factor SDE5 [Macadamia integrifolia]|uniref:putative nuclear RNA export factor SDE5 n=1 Tax=Macadamia integrifolia TaxID=60698 RepID=UPI001C4E6DA1|nr:putative nuclear RNA export factor SDE5 [Macadamia integrifolia]XP_042487712.1 putative nuclear RNA export factor SDE5 [Macadamia integrifolia]XP_042487717.1 putative nuclear RNA export factor SDE5 [Macadamia integrifolia]
MDTRSSCVKEYDGERQALEHLYDAFGSVASLKEIANAYCKAGNNVDLAGEILSGLRGSSSNSLNHASNAKLRDTNSSESLSDESFEKASCGAKNSKAAKQRRYPVSVGTVSSVIGKGYVKPPPVQSGSCKVTKPLKLDSKELPMNVLWREDVSSDFAAKNDAMCKDLEEFLIQILENGFQLDMNLIQEVLGSCGYDIKKFTDDFPKSQSLLCQEKSQNVELVRRNGTESPDEDKKRYDLQKEVLTALFNVPERTEELPRSRPVKAVRRTRAFGTLVVEPPRETTRELPIVTMVSQQKEGNDVDEDESYQILRRATVEHRATMTEYYKAAIDSFVKGDRNQAKELLKQAELFNNKAREADEKSAQMMIKGSNETQDEMTLDLHNFDAKEAIRFLKFQLSSVSGIPVIQYLKVIVESNAADTTKGARKRLKGRQLIKESDPKLASCIARTSTCNFAFDGQYVTIKKKTLSMAIFG